MIFRALFWISLVAILMPHEPDLGLGRPGVATALIPSNLSLPQALANPTQICNGHEQACNNALDVVDWFQQNAVKSLETVKAEIEEQQRASIHHAG